MKAAYIFFLIFFAISNFCKSQDQNDLRWNQLPATYPNLNPTGVYSELPMMDLNFSAPKEPRKIVTPNATFAVSPNYRVHPRNQGTQSETPIAQNSSNAYILFGSANTFQGGNFSTGNYITTNGGFSWYGNDTLGGNIANYGDPAPVIDKNGRFIISFIHAPTFKMGTSFSVNKGFTWSSPAIIPTFANSTDKNMSVTDVEPGSNYYGRTYVVYTEFDGPYANRIVISHSDNGGQTWSLATPVSPVPDAFHYCLGADIALDTGGTVYVVWGYNIINGQNSTEDYMGFAKSFNGGANWVISDNMAVDMNGLRTDNLFNGIRCNGFPRIDIDRVKCHVRCSWIYVVTGEKYFYPADGVADIVVNRSTDKGVTWTRHKVNQNTDPANYDYMPAIRVDETGSVNICYYSTRNSPGNTDAEIYLARSTTGGDLFIDVKVSDHSFTPSPIPGTASGYQGDYIGITSGNGKVWPYWCENGVTGRYQAWTASVDINGSVSCSPTGDHVLWNSNFLNKFPPQFWYTAILWRGPALSGATPEPYWYRSSVSAYGIDTGSAVFKAYEAPYGFSEAMRTFDFDPLGSNVYLSFDEAYAPNTNSELGPDSLIVECSMDGGLTYTSVASYYGSLSGGTLNTAPATNSSFEPTPSQWASKMCGILPLTNKVQIRAVSGNGNNIFIDNVKFQILNLPVAGSLQVIPQGYYNSSLNNLNSQDTVRIYLQQSYPPYATVDSSVTIVDPFTLNANVYFANAVSGNYYVRVIHRNCIETWSKSGGEVYTRGTIFNYDFTNTITKAYGNNLRQVDNTPVRYAIYSGEVVRDGIIDLNDIIAIYNNVTSFVGGYVLTDLNGDLITNLSDMLTAYNNSVFFVHIIIP